MGDRDEMLTESAYGTMDSHLFNCAKQYSIDAFRAPSKAPSNVGRMLAIRAVSCDSTPPSLDLLGGLRNCQPAGNRARLKPL